MFTAIVNLITSILRAVLPFAPGRPSPVTPQSQPKSFSANVVRADDLLVLRLDFYNARLQPTAGGKDLVSDGPGDSFVIVNFPPQHIAEQAFDEGEPTDPVQSPPVAARMAGESQLVFHLNPALLPLNFSLESILKALPLCAPLISDQVSPPPPVPPVGGTTRFGGARSQFSAIEAPWRLILSPHQDGRWTHSATSVTLGGKTELWHTRLGVRPASGSTVDEKTATTRTVRAVHSPDYRGSFPSPLETDRTPFRSGLQRYDRHHIVKLTADRTFLGNAPVAVERLMLSSLGAGMHLFGLWDTTDDVVEWRHVSTLGRDQFVKVVKKGFMFPLGHRALKFTITERKLEMGTKNFLEGKPVAYSRQRTFIVIREPVKSYLHREFPFRTVTFTRLNTPTLVDPTGAEIIPLATPEGTTTFWPRFGPARTDVQFELEGIDWNQQTSRFTAPLIFVPFSADQGADIEKLVDAYNDAGPLAHIPEAPRRTVSMGGQKVAFAPPRDPGDTTLDTDTLILGALKAVGTPHFLPAMRGALVNNPALRQVSNGSPAKLVRFEDNYLKGSPTQFGNAGEVFLKIDAASGVKFPVEKTGGLVAPDFTPQGFSRSFGPAGDIANVASGSFKPASIFAGIKILGGIPLDKIFQPIPFNFPSQAGPTVPGLTTVQTKADFGGVPTDVIQTRYLWVVNRAQLAQQPIFEPGANAKFTLDVEINTPLVPKPPKFHVKGQLDDFEILLPPAVPLVGAKFENVTFEAGTDRKVDVSIKFLDIVFKGDLTFVNDIRKYIPLDGFVDPPYIDVSSQGISAGFTLGIPTIGVGIFTLQDVSLSAGFFLPFIGGAATLRFAFCERDHPFLLTVSLFGGGGFFGLDLDTEKVTNIEASLEFGAAIAINLGVAEGKASITAGVYYQKSGAGFQITAFFRAAGSLSVLGIISISVELYIGLTYKSKELGPPHAGKLFGTASVKVKIKIVFFSISVSISIEREFAGTDPTFKDMLTDGDWGEYCNAFAVEV